MHLVGFASDSASERVCGFDVSARLTASLVTRLVSILPGSCGDEDRHFICFFLEEEKNFHQTKTWSQLGCLHPNAV